MTPLVLYSYARYSCLRRPAVWTLNMPTQHVHVTHTKAKENTATHTDTRRMGFGSCAERGSIPGCKLSENTRYFMCGATGCSSWLPTSLVTQRNACVWTLILRCSLTFAKGTTPIVKELATWFENPPVLLAEWRALMIGSGRSLETRRCGIGALPRSDPSGP